MPVGERGEFLAVGGDNFRLVRVLRRAVDLVEDAEFSGHEFLGKFVGGVFVGHVVVGGDERELAALARVRAVEGAGVELGALAEALDEAEAVVVHRSFHHLEDVIRIRVRGAGHEGRARRDGLLHRVDGAVTAAPNVGLGLVAERGGGRGLVLGQAVDPVVHHAIGQLHVLARGVGEVIAADGEGIAVAAEDEDVEVRARERNAAGEGQRATVDEVRAVRLHEVGEAAGAADAGHGGDLLVVHLALLDELEVEREHGEVSAAGAPRGVVGGDLLLRKTFSVGVRKGRDGHEVEVARAGEGFRGEGEGGHVLKCV